MPTAVLFFTPQDIQERLAGLVLVQVIVMKSVWPF
jgi:hypothetical protein